MHEVADETPGQSDGKMVATNYPNTHCLEEMALIVFELGKSKKTIAIFSYLIPNQVSCSLNCSQVLIDLCKRRQTLSSVVALYLMFYK